MKRKIVSIFILTVLLFLTSMMVAFSEDLSEVTSEKTENVKSMFLLSDDEPLTVFVDNAKVTLVSVDMFVDPSGDGKVSVVDARLLLRYATLVEFYTGSIEDIDVTEDGVINVVDARLVLRYCAELDNYYRFADGSAFSGFCKTDDGQLFYIDDCGIVSTGLKTIDGFAYYVENGFVASGAKTILGTLYLFDSEGKGVNGESSVGGKTLYFVNGKSFTGYRNVSGSDIYYAQGEPATGSFTVNDKKVYFKDGKLYTGYLSESGKNVYYCNGEPANGTFEINGTNYYFENGISISEYKIVNGQTLYYSNGIIADGITDIGSDTYCFSKGIMQYSWKNINDEYYFFDRSNGKMAKNTTVDGLQVGADGKAVKTTYSVEKIKTFIKARDIMLSITNTTDTIEEKKLKCFEWVMGCSYKQYRKVGASMSISGWEMLFANDIFDYRKGCCGSTSAAFAFLAVEAGCKSVYFCDDGISTAGHAWVTMEGNNRVYDITFAESKEFKSNYDASVSDYRCNAPRKTYIGG